MPIVGHTDAAETQIGIRSAHDEAHAQVVVVREQMQRSAGSRSATSMPHQRIGIVNHGWSTYAASRRAAIAPHVGIGIVERRTSTPAAARRATTRRTQLSGSREQVAACASPGQPLATATRTLRSGSDFMGERAASGRRKAADGAHVRFRIVQQARQRNTLQ